MECGALGAAGCEYRSDEPEGSIPNWFTFRLGDRESAIFLNQDKTGFGGQTDDCGRATFATEAVTACDETSECQGFFVLIGFHGRRI
jgi:hypothetical protein